MSRINSHGLTDYIPESVKRAIRQECGFGCASCGAAIVEYHHFDPPFVDAQEHRSEGIILLCPTCHSKFGDLPPALMRSCRESPRCKRDGFTRDTFLFLRNEVPSVTLGNITATNGQILKHGNRVLLGLAPPEDGGPLRFTCDLVDEQNVLLLSILNNELTVGIDHFDVKLTKKALTIWKKSSELVFRMITNRLDEVRITHLETAVAGGSIHCSPSRPFSIQSPSGGQVLVNGSISGEVGIWVTDDGLCLVAVGPGAPGVAIPWKCDPAAEDANEPPNANDGVDLPVV